MNATDRLALNLGRLIIQGENLTDMVESLTAENEKLKAEVAKKHPAQEEDNAER